MPWLCYSCNTPQEIVFTAKFANIFTIGMCDLCLRCIQTKAEHNIGTETFGGYDKIDLQHNALQLMECPHCHEYRSEILLSKPNDMCCNCFTYYMYNNTQGSID